MRVILSLTTAMMLTAAAAAAPINTTCPISGKNVDASSPTVTIDGSDVAVCCARCQAKVNAMDATAKTAMLASLVPAKLAPEAIEITLTKAYLLPGCPLSGKGIDSMGKPATKTIGGREVMVCCPGCFKRIEENQDKYNAKINTKIVERQRKTYPLNTCVISGRPLGEAPVDVVIGNRLVRVCCDRCAAKVSAAPLPHLKTLDAALLAKTPQKPDDTCIVSGRPLGASPKAVVIGNRVIRTCCGNCLKKVTSNPREWVLKVDARTPIAPKKAS